MGNHIKFEATGEKFEATGEKIVQIDDAFKSRVVVFECNKHFEIRFDPQGKTFYDPKYKGADEPINTNPVTFESNESKPKEHEDSLHEIKIKFSNIDHAGGYKYTVILKSGVELDPRICPK